MPSIFVNRNGRENRRNIRSLREPSGGETGVKELMFLADFNTFIFHNPGACGSDRWSSIITGANLPYNSEEIPIGLFNPWNDGADAPRSNQSIIAPRTPTRAIFGFDMRGVTTNINILSADLNLTVSRHKNWIDPNAPRRVQLFQDDSVPGEELASPEDDSYTINPMEEDEDFFNPYIEDGPATPIDDWYKPEGYPSILPWDGKTIIDGWKPCFWWLPGYTPNQSAPHPNHPPNSPKPTLQVPTSDPISAGACPMFMSTACVECLNCRNGVFPYQLPPDPDCFTNCRLCTLIFNHEGRWWLYHNGDWYFIADWYRPGDKKDLRLIPYVPGLGVPVDCGGSLYPTFATPSWGNTPSRDWIKNPTGKPFDPDAEEPGFRFTPVDCNQCEQLLGISVCGGPTGNPSLIPTFPLPIR